MAGQVVHLRTLVLMARKTDFALGVPRQNLVAGSVYLVARAAAYVRRGMRATRPMVALGRVVAIEAGSDLHVGRRPVRAAENKVRRRARLTRGLMQHVPSARTMARLASRLRSDAMARAVN